MRYNKRTFLLFVLPSIAVFLLVVMVPFLKGIIASFTNWKTPSDAMGESFNGLDNYKAAFQDDIFMKSFGYTIQYTLVAIVMINAVGLSLALLLNKAFKGRNIFRAAFFLPNLIGGMVLGYIWQLLFKKGFESLGLEPWLTTKTNTFFAMIIVTTWQYAGYVMIIFVAALQSVPRDQIEAAKISGAKRFRIYRKVILPNLMPAFTVTLFIALSRAIKVFDLTVSLTNGGINDSGTVAHNIYQSAWFSSEANVLNHFGVAQAKAMLFTLFVSSMAIAQVTWTKRREIVA